MKASKLLACLLALLLLLACVSCGNAEENSAENGRPDGDVGENENGDAEDLSLPYTHTYTYLPEEENGFLSDIIGKSCVSVYSKANLPYAIQDCYSLSGCRVKDITIPVFSVRRADEDGNFLFTIYRVTFTSTNLQKKPKETYELKINAEKYGLTEMTEVRKVITVDLSDLNIVLAENETLAFYGEDDTLFPAFMPKGVNEGIIRLEGTAPYACGFFTHVGTDELSLSEGALAFNFTLEKDYAHKSDYLAEVAEEEAFASLVASLKEKYAGKYLSVLGDSISTYGNVSNNTSYNSTIGGNAVYYAADGNRLCTKDATYWGRLLLDLDMKLCVNNSWSGGYCYGKEANGYKDSAVARSNQLHQTASGQKPDVILFYNGINDLHNAIPVGALYTNRLAADPNADLTSWMNSLLEKTENGTETAAGTDYTSFAEAYALALYHMKTKYPDAEVFCCELVPSGHAKDSDSLLLQYNTVIKALANYFGYSFVNWSSCGRFNRPNIKTIASNDLGGLHPNGYGHYLMEHGVLEAMAEKQK